MGLKLTTDEKDDTTPAVFMPIGSYGVVVRPKHSPFVDHIVLRTNNEEMPLINLTEPSWLHFPELRVRLLKPGTTLTVC